MNTCFFCALHHSGAFVHVPPNSAFMCLYCMKVTPAASLGYKILHYNDPIFSVRHSSSVSARNRTER